MKRLLLEVLLKLRILRRSLQSFTGMSDDVFITGRLYAKKISSTGEVTDLGLVSTKLVTNAGANWIAAFMAGTGTAVMKYIASGTGTTAPAVTDTALGTEVESRATGTQSSSTNVYTVVGTIAYASSHAITECGVLSASTAGTLLDRFTFTAINVTGGSDSIQFTVNLTFPAGS